MRFACCGLLDFLKNKMKWRTLQSRNLILFLIFFYWNRENKTPKNTVSPKSWNSVPAELSTNKVFKDSPNETGLRLEQRRNSWSKQRGFIVIPQVVEMLGSVEDHRLLVSYKVMTEVYNEMKWIGSGREEDGILGSER